MTDGKAEEYMDFDNLRTKLKHFSKKREGKWDELSDPKDIAIAISVEAGELLEMFQLMKDSNLESIKNSENVKERVRKELEEVIDRCLGMADMLGISPEEIVPERVKRTAKS